MNRLMRGIVTRALLPMACASFGAQAQTRALAVLPSDRVVAPIDLQAMVQLPGNVHPMARPENDAGPVPPDYPMPHLVLVLKRSAEQQAALDALSLAQQDPQSSLYHQWLGPAEFGAHYGISQRDLDAVAGWLRGQGFTIDDIPSEHWLIKFSGTARQVEAAFHTPIHFYRGPEGLRFANVSDQQIPQALADVIVGVAALHNFEPRPQGRTAPRFVNGSSHYMEPSDFHTIYNLNPLLSGGIDGTGQSIAVTAPCSIDLSVVFTYWADYVKGGKYLYYSYYGSVRACNSGEAGEAYLDLEWSGAVATGASVRLVASSDGIMDAAYQAVHNKLAPIVTTSYGACEQALGAAGFSAWDQLWATAAAYGITALVSSGDGGAAGCDDFHTESVATMGLGVNGFCSSKNSLCVGGTQFDDVANPAQFWSGSGAALGHIPEVAWNESGLAAGGMGLWSSSGGYSVVSGNTRPPWQTGNTHSQRGVPDVALSAAAHDGYIDCPNAMCGPNSGYFWYANGTSAASPSFAGIMALVVQKTGQWQGNVGPILYQLAANSGLNAFHDITSGNNSVPGQAGYSAAPGWDPVTGLGSVDANNLITHWPGAAPSAATVTLSIGQLQFASQVVGTTSGSQVVTVTNSGSAALNIGQLTIGGANSGDFPTTTNCLNTTLAATKSCVVTVTFKPTVTGTRIAVVTIPDNAGDSPQTIQITGTGISAAPTFSVSNTEVSKVAPSSSGCTPPPATSSFLTTDGLVYLFYDAMVTGSDTLTSDWLAPNGDVIAGDSWGTQAAGSYCFTGDSLNISNPKAGHFGTWQARIYDNGKQVSSASFTIATAGGGSGVVVNSGGVVNNASFVAQVSPGSLFSIFGNFMSSGTMNGFPIPLPTSYNGTIVTVNGIQAPLLYVSPTLINAQVPVNVAAGTATVTVSYNGSSASTTVPVMPASPGLFYSTVNGVNFGLAQHSNGTFVTTANPARSNETVGFYGTGIGPVTPALASGAGAGAFPNLSTSSSPYSGTINGANATIGFLGLTPGLVGLMQLNIQVPPGAPAGNLPLFLTINGVRSQANIFIPVLP